MAEFEPDKRTLMTYAIGGAAVVGVVLFLIVLVAGGPWYLALPVGLFVGIVVGGGLGFLVGGRVDQMKSESAG